MVRIVYKEEEENVVGCRSGLFFKKMIVFKINWGRWFVGISLSDVCLLVKY